MTSSIARVVLAMLGMGESVDTSSTEILELFVGLR